MPKDDKDLALSVAAWLQGKGCVVSILANEGGWEVNYTLPEDIKPQPPVQIHRGTVVFPMGSQEDVIFTFLLSQ